MTAASWIVFGPDLEPLEAEARRRAEAPGPRIDGLLVNGDPDAVARRLAEAPGGWCRFDRADAEQPEAVHVQVAHVRFVFGAADQ